jgi:signal transduction histidine kinase/CBS domain-containing protein/DNA-binding NarL/FixJ family response regulator
MKPTKRGRAGRAARQAAAVAEGGPSTIVGALLVRSVPRVTRDQSLDAVERLLVEHELTGVPVADGTGHLVGWVSATDVGRGRQRSLVAVGDVMSPSPSALLESCSIVGAAHLMAELDLQQMPVVSEDRRVRGMVRSVDLLRWLAGGLDAAGPRRAGAPPEEAADEPPGSADPEMRLQTVLAHAPIWLLAVDRHGIITMVEGHRPLALGVTAGETPRALLGHSVFDRFGDVTGFAASCRLALGGHRHSASFSPWNSESCWEIRFDPLADATGQPDGFILVVLDVSERRRADEALKRSEQRLMEAGRLTALGSLAGGIAHQINNALTYMRLSVGRLISLERSLKPVTPVRQHRLDMLQDVREGIVRIERINSELTHFSRLDRGPLVAADLASLLESVTGMVAHEIDHRARLVCDWGAVPPVNASPPALRQVFLNLIMNAVQSLPDGEAHLHEIRVATRTDVAGRAVVEIGDTGQGIAPELLPRIFEPFFTTRPVGEGMGLGLAVCRDLVTSLGGEIGAESTPGRGTTIRLTLPPATSAQAALGTTAAAAAGAGAEAPGPTGATEGRQRQRVLLVDDQLEITDIVRMELELEGIDVVVTHSGREALDRFASGDRHFDVVLCDVMMPELSGADLHDAARVLDPDLAGRFVFMTGGAFSDRAARFLDEVTNPRIVKPFHMPELLQLIRGPARAGATARPDPGSTRPPSSEAPTPGDDPETPRSRS